MNEIANALIAYCRENGRACPQPTVWNDFYEILDNKPYASAVEKPSLPLILAAWHETPGLLKMLRLAEHIEWAEKHGCLDEVADYLRSLPEEDLYHIDD